MWQAYKQGIGVGLGLLTVYALALLLLAMLVRQGVVGAGQSVAEAGGTAQSPQEGGPKCSTSWA